MTDTTVPKSLRPSQRKIVWKANSAVVYFWMKDALPSDGEPTTVWVKEDVWGKRRMAEMRVLWHEQMTGKRPDGSRAGVLPDLGRAKLWTHARKLRERQERLGRPFKDGLKLADIEDVALFKHNDINHVSRKYRSLFSCLIVQQAPAAGTTTLDCDHFDPHPPQSST